MVVMNPDTGSGHNKTWPSYFDGLLCFLIPFFTDPNPTCLLLSPSLPSSFQYFLFNLVLCCYWSADLSSDIDHSYADWLVETIQWDGRLVSCPWFFFVFFGNAIHSVPLQYPLLFLTFFASGVPSRYSFWFLFHVENASGTRTLLHSFFLYLILSFLIRSFFPYRRQRHLSLSCFTRDT